MKTRKEIEDLKKRWIENPKLEIWREPGFEQVAEEIKAWTVATRESWENKEHERSKKFAGDVGLENHPELANWIRRIVGESLDAKDDQIRKLEHEMKGLTKSVNRLKQENDDLLTKYNTAYFKIQELKEGPSEIPF